MEFYSDYTSSESGSESDSDYSDFSDADDGGNNSMVDDNLPVGLLLLQ